jgi:hypothetical protein
MPNNSSTGGYLAPATSQGLPGGLTLTQFIQSVLVGISGVSGSLVRPKWQESPPKQPDISVNWIAFSIELSNPDQNAYVELRSDGSSVLQRQERVDVKCSVYGPDAIETISVLRDGFQIQQNLEALRLAHMGYHSVSNSTPLPDLFNERWYNRYEVTISLARQVQRTYPILSFVSASGTIHTDDENIPPIDWVTPEAP